MIILFSNWIEKKQ